MDDGSGGERSSGPERRGDTSRFVADVVARLSLTSPTITAARRRLGMPRVLGAVMVGVTVVVAVSFALLGGGSEMAVAAGLIGDGVPAYACPGEGQVDTLRGGQRVELTGRSGEWVAVKANGFSLQRVFVHEDFIDYDGNLEDIGSEQCDAAAILDGSIDTTSTAPDAGSSGAPATTGSDQTSTSGPVASSTSTPGAPGTSAGATTTTVRNSTSTSTPTVTTTTTLPGTTSSTTTTTTTKPTTTTTTVATTTTTAATTTTTMATTTTTEASTTTTASSTTTTTESTGTTAAPGPTTISFLPI